MKVFTSTQIEVNSFLGDHKEYDVKSFSVDVIKSQPYITMILEELEEDDEREYDLHFTLTSRKDGIVNIDEDGNVINFTTFVNKNVLRYAMLIATERMENKIAGPDGSEVDMIAKEDEIPGEKPKLEPGIVVDKDPEGKTEDKPENKPEDKSEDKSEDKPLVEQKPWKKGKKHKKSKKDKIETIGKDVIIEVNNA